MKIRGLGLEINGMKFERMGLKLEIRNLKLEIRGLNLEIRGLKLDIRFGLGYNSSWVRVGSRLFQNGFLRASFVDSR